MRPERRSYLLGEFRIVCLSCDTVHRECRLCTIQRSKFPFVRRRIVGETSIAKWGGRKIGKNQGNSSKLHKRNGARVRCLRAPTSTFYACSSHDFSVLARSVEAITFVALFLPVSFLTVCPSNRDESRAAYCNYRCCSSTVRSSYRCFTANIVVARTCE